MSWLWWSSDTPPLGQSLREAKVKVFGDVQFIVSSEKGAVKQLGWR
jgi:hypothetical protein